MLCRLELLFERSNALFVFPISEEFKLYGFGNTKQVEAIPSVLIAPKRRLFPLLLMLLLALGV